MPAGERPDAPTRLVRLVLPGQTNHMGTLYGGEALSMMDTAGFIAATRHSRATFVTAGTESIDFRAPVREGEIAELTAAVVATGRTSVTVEIEMVGEELLTGARRLAARARFVFVAVDGQGRPTPLDQPTA